MKRQVNKLGKVELPSGWKSVRLGDVCEIIMGQSPSSEFYNICNAGMPLIQGNADIKNRKTIIRIFTSQITKTAQKGDIIMSVRAPVGEIASTEFDCCIGRGVCAIRGNQYIYYYLEFFESKWYRLSQGSTFDSITGELLNNLPIPFPSLSEQKAIAEILTNADKLIVAKERLIVAKQKQKQWLMQNLLTGKRRLSGFSGEWEKAKLGEVCKVNGGGTPSTKNKDYWNGHIPWISSSDIIDGDIYNIFPTRFITESAINNSATQICPKNTILIVSRVGVGKIAIAPFDLCTSQDFTNLSNINQNVMYITFILAMLFKKTKFRSQGTSIKGLTVNEIKNIHIRIPPLPEQQAIANVLTTADREIELLKKELEQHKQIKKYLMQKLLTGKIRVKGASE